MTMYEGQQNRLAETKAYHNEPQGAIGRGSPEVARPREIPTAINQLEHTVSGLEAVVEKLEARLAPVWNASPEPTREKDDHGFATGAASAIGVQAMRINNIIRRLHSLEALVEL